MHLEISGAVVAHRERRAPAGVAFRDGDFPLVPDGPLIVVDRPDELLVGRAAAIDGHPE